jgi:hypothetical protein
LRSLDPSEREAPPLLIGQFQLHAELWRSHVRRPTNASSPSATHTPKWMGSRRIGSAAIYPFEFLAGLGGRKICARAIIALTAGEHRLACEIGKRMVAHVSDCGPGPRHAPVALPPLNRPSTPASAKRCSRRHTVGRLTRRCAPRSAPARDPPRPARYARARVFARAVAVRRVDNHTHALSHAPHPPTNHDLSTAYPAAV